MSISTDDCRLHGSHRVSRFLAVAVVLCLVLNASVSAAETDPSSAATAASSDDEARSQPKCVHGCERWGRVCNVDPRGDYKCRRRCEKFGKICE